jgi:hypothetical protein
MKVIFFGNDMMVPFSKALAYSLAMAPPRINFEFISARFPKETLARIDAVLREGEAKAEFIRNAVFRELLAREAVRKRHQRLIASLRQQLASEPSPASE